MRQGSLRNRMTGLLLIFALLPLLLLGLIGVWQATLQAHKDRENLQQEVALRAAAILDTYFINAERDLQSVISELDVRSTNSQRIIEQLSDEIFLHNTFDDLALVDRSGQERARVSRLGVVPANRLINRANDPAFFEPLTDGRAYFGPVMPDALNQEPLLLIGLPILDAASGETSGVLIGETRLRLPLEQITAIEYGNDGLVSVVGSDDHLIAHRDPTQLQQIGMFAPLERARVQPTGLAGFFSRVFPVNDVVTAMPYTRDHTAMTVVVELPQSEAIAPVLAALGWIGLTVLGTALLTTVAGFGLSHRFVQPVETLARATEAVSAGDLEQQVAVTRNDELGILQRNFNTMVSSLRQQQAAIASRNQEIAQANAELAERNQEIAHRNQELLSNLAMQRSLLETINRLSAPILPVWSGVVVLPLIGQVDTTRARRIMESLLEGVEQRRARILILDVTGLALVDDQVINLLLEATQAVRLLGAEVMLVGVSPAIAELIVRQDVDLRQLAPYPDLESAVRAAIKALQTGTPVTMLRSNGNTPSRTGHTDNNGLKVQHQQHDQPRRLLGL